MSETNQPMTDEGLCTKCSTEPCAEHATAAPTREAVRRCAEWLALCLRWGWQKEDLDFLERLWWERHDRHGTLIGASDDD